MCGTDLNEFDKQCIKEMFAGKQTIIYVCRWHRTFFFQFWT